MRSTMGPKRPSFISLAILGVFTINFVTSLPTIDDATYKTIRSQLRKSNVCTTPACKKAASIFLAHIDETVNPCDNFYRFACGKFLNNTEIPANKNTVDETFTQESDKLNEQLKDGIENGIKESDPKSFKKMKMFYDICMNEEQIEKNADKEFLELINRFGGWPVLLGESWDESNYDWLQTTYNFREAGLEYNYFFEFSIAADLKNNSIRRIYLDQPTLGLPTEFLSQGLNGTFTQVYFKFMVDIAEVFGADRKQAEKELIESLKFEIDLAKISQPKSERRDINNMYNPMTIEELETKYPGIPYLDYTNKILSPYFRVNSSEVVIVQYPEYFKKFVDVLSKTPKRVQANYVFWRQTREVIGLLSERVTDAAWKLNSALVGVSKKDSKKTPRWKKCLGQTDARFKLAMGSLYIRRYFDQETKECATEMTDHIRASFKRMLTEITWMDGKTKEQALEKLAYIRPYLAYPDELLDDNKLDEIYAPLKLYPESLLKSSISYVNYSLALTFERLSKPINKTDWVTHAETTMVNAFYNPVENSIQIPAAILQGLFFSKDHPRYMNYAAIGSILGHEMTHGFDDQGSRFDKYGNLIDWWERETKKKYVEKAQCIIDQYSNYTVKEVGLNVNGVSAQGENIADNGGLKEAYYAYETFEKKKGVEPHLPGLESYSSRQMFWLSNANIWCMKYRPEILKLLILTDPHTPNEFRIIGTMSNLPEFSKDFNCPLGSPMNPEKKCTVW